jgi:hypothetical protein
MTIEGGSNSHAGGVRLLVRGALPIVIVCLFLWGLVKEPSPSPMAITVVFAACGIVLWFGWSSIRRNIATKWLAVPLVVFIGLFLGLFVFGLALGVAAYLGAALLVALPYLVYDLLFRAPLEGRIDRDRAGGPNLHS